MRAFPSLTSRTVHGQQETGAARSRLTENFWRRKQPLGLGFCVVFLVFCFFFPRKGLWLCCGGLIVVVGSFLNLEAEPGTGSSSLCSGETQTSFENSALTLGLRDFSLLFRHDRRPPLNSGEAIMPPFKGFLAFLSRAVAAVTGLQAYRGLMMQPAKFSPKMDSVRTFVPFFTSQSRFSSTALTKPV